MDTRVNSNIFLQAKKQGRWLLFLLVAHAVYASLFILRTSFAVEGQRYFCLVDDAMVSMRYAKNLAAGFGWVWNPGEDRVEGYTNPLWCLVMALVHLIPIPAAKTSLVIQLLGEVFLIANLITCYFIAKLFMSARAAVLCVALIAWYYPLNNWALQGMEVGPLAWLVSLSCLLLLRNATHPDGLRRLFFPTTLAMALRLDGIVSHIVAVASAFVTSRRRLRVLFWGVLTALVVVGGWTLFRLAYYGDLWPNTYYLKMTGFPSLLRMTRGTFQAAVFWVCWLWPAALLLFAALISGRKPVLSRFVRVAGRRKPRLWLIPAAFVAAQTLYSIYVGGDAWERVTGANRFIAPAMPLAFVLLLAAVELALRLTAPRFARPAFLGFACLFALNANAYYGKTSLAQAFLLRTPPYVEDNVRNVKIAFWLEQVTTPHARIAIDYAGTAPYFSSRTFIDLLGKSDRHVARLPAHRGMLGLPAWREFYPGHLKWDYAYSIGQLQPDVVCAIWRKSIGDAPRYLAKRYFESNFEGVSVYFRKDSAAIRWQAITTPLAEVVAP